ncbi:sensor histidine kinase [Christiangramia sp. SM2212]
MDFNPEFVDMVVMIKSTTELLRTSLEEKAINIHLNLPTNLILYVDKRMIEVVFRNLISNAIKFTPKQGTISVDTTEKENLYLFSVTDNGVGIKEAHIDKLFRIDSTYSSLGTNNERGTGLGLILCKDFIDYHKGKIWVESKHNVGSKFYVSIPKSYH